MTTTPAQKVAIAEKFGLVNVRPMYRAARRVGIPFRVACALYEKESGGRNIYGHDEGGALSTNGRMVTVSGVTYGVGANIPVTPQNFGVFLLKIGAGAKSNGVGPSQITYAADLPDGRTGGYFRQMMDDENLDPADPEDNMVKGLSILWGHWMAQRKPRSWVVAGRAYNGRLSYGVDLAAKIVKWRLRFR
jgi:hypothetical protein